MENAPTSKGWRNPTIIGAVIGAIAAILVAVIGLLPKDKPQETTHIKQQTPANAAKVESLSGIAAGGNIKDSTIVHGSNNIVNNRKNIINQYRYQVIKELYPEIILDYQSALVDRIIQDFGEPYSKFDSEYEIGSGYKSEGHIAYNYPFNNGSITFYVDKENNHATAVMVSIKDYNTEILVPPIHDRGPNYPKIILGKSKFRDLFTISKPDKVYTNRGSAPGAVYTEAEFYMGRYGNYATFTFGLGGFYDEKLDDFYDNRADENYEILSDKIPDYVIIN